MWRYAELHGKLHIIDWRFDLSDPFCFWAGLLGGGFLSLGTHGVNQMTVQRYLAARSQTDASWAAGLSGLVVFFQFTLFLALGIGMAACFHHQPPITPDGEPLANDQALAFFALTRLPAGVGLIGLILAGLLAAAMSTLSSSLNASASVMVSQSSDAGMAPAGLFRRGRLWTLVFGAVQTTIAVLAAGVSNSVVAEALAIAGLVNGAVRRVPAGLVRTLRGPIIAAVRYDGRAVDLAFLSHRQHRRLALVYADWLRRHDRLRLA